VVPDALKERFTYIFKGLISMALHFEPLEMKATHSSEMPGITYPSDAASCHRKPESLDTVSLIIIRSDQVLHIGLSPLKVKLNPICHLLALLGAHLILHVSRIRVKGPATDTSKTITDVVMIAVIFKHIANSVGCCVMR